MIEDWLEAILTQIWDGKNNFPPQFYGVKMDLAREERPDKCKCGV
jgi:hypothetical protein